MSAEIVVVLVDDDDDEAKFVCPQIPFRIDFGYIRIINLMMLIKIVILFCENRAQHRYANLTFKN